MDLLNTRVGLLSRTTFLRLSTPAARASTERCPRRRQRRSERVSLRHSCLWEVQTSAVPTRCGFFCECVLRPSFMFAPALRLSHVSRPARVIAGTRRAHLETATDAFARPDLEMAEIKTPTDVLHFWFGEEACTTNVALMGDIAFFRGRCKTLWYAGTSADPLCAPFAATLEAAASGTLDAHPAWTSPESYPTSAIAKVLLYDQFSRNVFRGTKKAFSFDDKALVLSRALCADASVVDTVGASAMHFILSPLMHSEALADHDLALDVNSRLATRAKDIADGGRGAFVQHRDVIARFGRYPHRNAAMGRVSTDEEKAWLASEDVPGWAKSQ